MVTEPLRRSARVHLAHALAGLLLASAASAQGSPSPDPRTIRFPDVEGYTTLKVDLHTHSVFSDGSVWPDIRVQEAIRDGLDAISLTEHLEYQPHGDDIPHPDRNRAYQLALEMAEGTHLLIVPGSEVTRSLPPGHINAVFVTDSNRLLLDDPIDVLREARSQGAYLFWNHPHWVGQQLDGIATMTDTHRRLRAEGLLHGIEVVNDLTISEEALDIALRENLAILGTSDIHGLVDWQYGIADGGHRPITLALAEERSLDGLKDALFAGRTVAWFEQTLVGRREHLVPLLEASLEVDASAGYVQRWRNGEQVDSQILRVDLINRSSARFVLRNLSEHNLHDAPPVLMLDGHSTQSVQFTTNANLDTVEIRFEVLSALIGPDRHPVVTWTAPVGPPAPAPSTDIVLLERAGLESGTPTARRVTDRPGYDNQPSFLPDGRLVYSSMAEDGTTDIKVFDPTSGSTGIVADLDESLYSPTAVPAGVAVRHPAVSVIRDYGNQVQQLWSLPLDGGAPELLQDSINPIGYHAWIDDERFILFVLGTPHTLQIGTVRGGRGVVVHGSPGRSLSRIPTGVWPAPLRQLGIAGVDFPDSLPAPLVLGSNLMSFLHAPPDVDGAQLLVLDPSSRAIQSLVQLPAGAEDVAWSPEGSLWVGTGSEIRRWNGVAWRSWDLNELGLSGITRLAWSADGESLAVVVTRND